jgi:helicase
VRTSEYQWYIAPFPEFNEAQAAVVPFLDQDVNIVVAFPTATGKTVLAECAFAYHLASSDDCRVVYVCPYRSLGAQRYTEWVANSQFAKYGIFLSSGDQVPSAQEWERCRIGVLTVESFDSKVRSASYADWVGKVACVVFDEAHLLGEKVRGAALEAALMRFTEANPASRILMLSATMGNAMDVAKWVKRLNGKPTKCVRSSWRPTGMNLSFHEVERDEEVEKAVGMAVAFRGKTIVFVHSKRIGHSIASGLAAKGIRCGFHNASVPRGRRARMESEFDNPSSGFNVLVSTSTLGAGVNIGG